MNKLGAQSVLFAFGTTGGHAGDLLSFTTVTEVPL